MQHNRLSRREFLKWTSLGVAGLAVTACVPAPAGTTGSAGEQGGAAAQPAGEAATLQYYIGFGAGSNPDQVTAVQELFAKFTEGNANVAGVEPLVVPWEEAPRKFQTMVAGGTPPDVITMGMSQWDFAAKGAFVDIKPLAERDGLDLADWDQSAIDAYTVMPRNNMLYGLPFGLNDQCMVYNKTLFDEKGVELPPASWQDESWTWDSLLDKASQLTSGEGVEKAWGVGGIGGNWVVPWCYGGAWVDESQTKISLAEPGAMQGVQLNYDLMQTHGYMPTDVDVDAMGGGNIFLTGKVGIYTEGSWGVTTLLQIEDFEWGLAPIPYAPGADINKRASSYYPDALVVSSNKAVDQSWDLVKFMVLDDENYKTFLRIMTMIPARKALRGWFVDEFWKGERPDINWDAFMDGFNYAQVQRLFLNINWSEVNNTQAAALDPLWLGESTPEQVIPGLAEQLQEIWTRGIEQLPAS